MPVEAACPSCEGKFRLPDAAAGKKIRCPKCKGPLEVPPLSADAPEAPTAPTPTLVAPAAEDLKSAWRTASQEPAPVEVPRQEVPKEIRKETPKPASEPTAPQVSSQAVSASTQPAKSTVTKPKPSPPPVETTKKKTATPTTPVAPTITPTPAPKPKPPEPAPAPLTPPAAATVAPAAPAAEQWFLKGEDGETFGPIDRATLDAWHDEGRMTADSQVLQAGTEQWQWASDLYPSLEEPAPGSLPGVPDPTPVASMAVESSIHANQDFPADVSSVSQKTKAKAKTVVPRDDDDEDETGERLSPHSKPVAVLLAFTLGMFGIHRFYLGYVGIGLAMFFTFGGLLMWSITDALRILFGHVPDSEGLKLRD